MDYSKTADQNGPFKKKYNSNKQINKKRDMVVSFVKRFLEGSSGFRDAR